MKPLYGLRIAVTRAESQSHELADPLQSAGAHVIICPLIHIAPLGSGAEVHHALQRLPDFDWIVFTSVNGVELFVRTLHDSKLDAASINARVACVGPATAAAARHHGFEPNIVPAEYVGDAVPAALVEAHGGMRGKKILLPRAQQGGSALPDGLRKSGADVFDLPLYRTLMHGTGAELLRAALSAGEIDLLTFTSGSAIKYFVQAIGSADHVRIAVIGPSTAAAARSHGLPVDIEANPHTVAGLVSAILEDYAAQ